jgi:predicted 2-oxoglutarate/Fe(II)-dependent dioxygenase YbiX
MYREDVLVQKGAIDRGDLKTLIEYVRRAQLLDSLVSNEAAEDDAETQWVVDKNVRDTQEVQLSESIVAKLGSIDRALVAAYINPFYAVEVRDSEPWQILHYGVGGHYIPHVDAETLYKDDEGLDLWEKTLDRDLSIVCFLNDDFDGGELVFPALDLVIEPSAGTLVCFPSDHNFVHGVRPVRAGHRYTAVSWMRVIGMPAPDEINQQTMDEYHRHWPQQIEQRSRIAKGGKP